MLVFRGGYEGANHSAIVVRIAGVQNIKPEVIALLVRIAVQVAEILYQHKGRIVVSAFYRIETRQVANYKRATVRLACGRIVASNQAVTLRAKIASCSCQESI